MKRYLGYIRVSTAKQGEHGVSLQEQRDAIVRFAQRCGLEISEWFEERETAAKRGRPVFTRMLKLLQHGKASGLVIHKIDRGARNLKDWADLGELIDHGIEVHFANESLDLHSRGGRLSADIQAVVAADYIRNLREETRKGFYGRIKQGLYPLPAPLGYRDQGRGKLKALDPMRAPLVRKAFSLYASGRYNLRSLAEEMARSGIRNRNGGVVSINGWSFVLNNPFYMGLIRILRTGETFPGCHPPLIPKSLFDRVQKILNNRTNARPKKHCLLFRRFLRCNGCGYSLIGEVQKGHVYYRCQTQACPVTAVREEVVEAAVRQTLAPLQFADDERAYLKSKIPSLRDLWESERESVLNASRLKVRSLQDRLNRLTDAYIDGTIEKDLFERRKTTLLIDQKGVEEQLAALEANGQSVPDRLQEFLELAGSASLLYQMSLDDEKRDLLEIATSNRRVQAKNVDFVLAPPFRDVANRFENAIGSPYRDVPRTLDRMLKNLRTFFESNPTARITLPSTVLLEDSAGD
jgi:DNA invertase Pin-like site-specific DNA recombinase